jgi:hypothetical protein
MANELKVSKGLIVAGSGSTVASIQGSTGQLFSVTDISTGSVFTVKDYSGLSIFEIYPSASTNNNTYTILSSSIAIQTPRATSASFQGTEAYGGNIFKIIPSTNNDFTLAFNGTGNTRIKHSVSTGGTISNPGTGNSSSIDISATSMSFSTSNITFGNIIINPAANFILSTNNSASFSATTMSFSSSGDLNMIANNTIISSSLQAIITNTNSASFYGGNTWGGNAFRIIPSTSNNFTLAFNNTGITTIKHSTNGGGSHSSPGTGTSSSIQLSSTSMSLFTSDAGFGHINIYASATASITAPQMSISSSNRINITSVINLTSLNSLPAGSTGDMAVSASNLWFYSGSWKKVSLV